MSVFGGDSWGREAQHRKTRVDDLFIQGVDASSYKKLSSGKYACLVCPHNPILDTPLMLSMHCKGSRHLASAVRLKEKELRRQNEISKRIALSDSAVGPANSGNPSKRVKLAVEKPLIEQTRKVASGVLLKEAAQQNCRNQSCNVELSEGQSKNVETNSVGTIPCQTIEVSKELLAQQQLDFRERRERELKFTEAGWKRDCHGRWYKDENVEFDSDEEDPNICLG
ncbi:hypothetical protein Tsubulata_009207 [Turnera subulata]|uniref:Sodium channel modifier 1 n=1 Tax=Turnera subulata TaxID=218843 RepID=A0A9Q0FLA0_9ROSI|nr:hypothetical protein Tsubulata_009207 [Turnera subulata]